MIVNRFVRDFLEPTERLCSFGPEVAAGGMLLGEGIVGAEAAGAVTAAATAEAAAASAAAASFANVASVVKTIAPYAQVAGLGLQVASQIQAGRMARAQGQSSQKMAEYEAKQLEARANTERALAQRRALDERRRKALVQSNLQARAGASGAGFGPGIVDLAEDIESEGEYRALSALYEGEERARGLETGAGISRFEGGQAALAGRQRARGYYFQAGGAALSGLARHGGAGWRPT